MAYQHYGKSVHGLNTIHANTSITVPSVSFPSSGINFSGTATISENTILNNSQITNNSSIVVKRLADSMAVRANIVSPVSTKTHTQLNYTRSGNTDCFS